MRSEGRRSARGLVAAALLGLAGLAVAWACLRITAVHVLPTTGPQIASLAPHDPDVVFGKATLALTRRGGIADPADVAAVRRAAAAAPLDARAYLIVGSRQLAQGQPRLALATLEAGQRLDPRQRLIHALLLQQYLRSAQYNKAAAQFSVLARLVGSTQGPIARAIALMSTVPSLRGPVRRTLGSDPVLEQSVLTMMANGDAAPADIFDLASPTGLAQAGDKNGWGPVLVARLAANGRYALARAVWQRLYRVPDAQADMPVFNPGFRPLAASPPFNWTLAAGSLGAADAQNGGLSIEYYGRDSGDLASQLLLLQPGRYRFSFVTEGGRSDAASSLSWLLTCASGSKAVLMNAPVVASPAARPAAADIAVPADCPAQMLTLHGEAGEFPAPVNTSVRGLALRPIAGARP